MCVFEYWERGRAREKQGENGKYWDRTRDRDCPRDSVRSTARQTL